MRLTAVHAQTERKRQDRSARCAEKHRRRARKQRLRGLIRPVSAACATAGAAQGGKRLSSGRFWPIFMSDGTPLGECRINQIGGTTGRNNPGPGDNFGRLDPMARDEPHEILEGGVNSMGGAVYTGRGRTVIMVFAGGIAAQMLTIGIARFSFTPMLPVMLEETKLSPVTGGLLGAAIYAGYLAATFLLSFVRSPDIRWRLYQAGIFLSVVTCFSMSLGESNVLWVVSRFLAGASGAAGMLLATEFLLRWLTTRGGTRDLAPHFAGLGLGISLSGVVALLVRSLTWEGQWLAFGGLALVLAPACWLLVPRPPRTASGLSGNGHVQQDHSGTSPAWFWVFGLAYLTAGWGYSVGATFYVSILGSNFFWILLGLACAIGAIAGSAFARRFGSHVTLKSCYAVQIVAMLLLAFPVGQSLAILSAALFGGTFIAIVSLSLAEAGMRSAEPGRAMARMTLMYGIGQVGGPVVTGSLRSMTGSYTSALILAALLMGMGMLLLQVSSRSKL